MPHNYNFKYLQLIDLQTLEKDQVLLIDTYHSVIYDGV